MRAKPIKSSKAYLAKLSECLTVMNRVLKLVGRLLTILDRIQDHNDNSKH
jgi:hypothetical protein